MKYYGRGVYTRLVYIREIRIGTSICQARRATAKSKYFPLDNIIINVFTRRSVDRFPFRCLLVVVCKIKVVFQRNDIRRIETSRDYQKGEGKIIQTSDSGGTKPHGNT